MENKKQAALRFIEENRGRVNPRYRPAYHLAAPCGWINDPNGFCRYKGAYHLFYQYAPYVSYPGQMHWGHAVSEDLVNWRFAGVALAPDTDADSHQCWSGNAIEDNQGNLVLMYTGLHPDETGRMLQEQCLAVSADGESFVKPAQNPVLGAKDLPPDGSPYDFRDPKLFREGGEYRVLVANRGEKSGRQLLYASQDLRNWEYKGIFLENVGDMPECPDYFEMDGKAVMITSVMGLPAEGLRFQNGHNDVICLTGRREENRFIPETMEAVDLGPDFYAPQSVATPDGRRVMIGWMQMWGEDSPVNYLGHGWNGAMTAPRELFLREGRLYQLPLRELERLRGPARRWEDVAVQGQKELAGLEGRRYEMEIEMEVEESAQAEIRLLKTGDEYFVLHYDAGERTLVTDRSKCGWTMGPGGLWEKKPGGRARVPGTGKELSLRILVDTQSVEVFANGGALAMTTLAFPKGEALGIAFAGNFLIRSLTYWDIKAARLL